jgi:hypothetical protein
MTGDLARAIIFATLIAAGAYVFRGTYGTERWDLAPGPAGTVFRIDRLSGQVHHCDTVVCRVLPTATPMMAAPAAPPQRPPKPRSQGSAKT